tara:strand:- start:207 stop:800 length:594 start_codon:yes stop_codon:yes gene_type:complete
MSQIKLKHSGGNSVIIAAPSSNPASDRTITLPSDADGTLARTLDVAFKSYAIIADRKSAGSDGGTFTSGDWRTRDLNTELSDIDGIVSILSNQFTLQSGSYLLKAKAMGFRVERHMLRLYQTSGTAAAVAHGTSEYAAPTYIGSNSSFLSCRFTISTATTYELQHRCQTSKTDNGFGTGYDIGVNETFALVEIFKEA